MRQEELFVTVMRMKPGQCLNVYQPDFWEAVQGSIKSLLLDGPVRESDVKEFIRQIQNNWSVRVTESIDGKTYTILKLAEDYQWLRKSL